MKDQAKITTDHICSAIRGLQLLQASDEKLSLTRDTHAKSDAFASRAIVLAVDQVRALRTAQGK